MTSDSSKTIKVFGDYSVTLDAQGAILQRKGVTIAYFYPENPDDARDMASATSAIKRRMLQRAHALSVEDDTPTE